MNQKKFNIITGISAILLIIGVVMVYKEADLIISIPFLLAPMVLSRYMIYKLKKEKEKEKEKENEH